MNGETIKFLQRVIERQDEILKTSKPWTARAQLSVFNEKLKEALENQTQSIQRQDSRPLKTTC